MASSNPNDGSPKQKNPTHKTSQIQEITDKLTTLQKILTEAGKLTGAKKEESKDTQQLQEDGEEKDEKDISNQLGDGEEKDEKDISNQLGKAQKELSIMIGAFKKLVAFKVDISKPLETLERNVKDIRADLGRAKADNIPDEQATERNLKVLRSNITRIKIQIGLLHQVSKTVSETIRDLQMTVARQEVLPHPYEAKLVFESGSFVKEIQDHYEALDITRKLCLLCFAIFPENAEVKTRLLRFWWLGERLIVEGKDPKEDLVNKTLGEFVEKGFIEPVTKKSKLRATSYKMHPITRSLIIKLAMEANFFDYDSKGNPTMEISASKKSCLVKSEQASWFSKNIPQPGIPKVPESSDSQQNKNKPEEEEANQQAENETRGKQKQRLKQGTCCGSSKQSESGTKQQPESSDSQQDKSKPGKEKEHQQAENETRGKQKQRLKQGTCCGSSKQSESGTKQQPESSDNQQNKSKPGKKKEHQQDENETGGKQKQRLKQGTCCGSTKQSASGTKQQPESSDNQQKENKMEQKKEPRQIGDEKRKNLMQRIKQGTSSWFSKNFSQSCTEQQPKSSYKQQKENKQIQQNTPGKKDEEMQRIKLEKQRQKNLEEMQRIKLEKQRQKNLEKMQRIKLEKQRQKNLEEMQTLFNVSRQFPDLPVELFSKMKNIRVLHLGRWESTAERHIEVESADFLTGLKNMKKLRFFSLHDVSGIRKLPKSLCKLVNLTILDLRACHNLEELPDGIGSLNDLAYLDLSQCYVLDIMPKTLCRLSNLRVLKGFVISKYTSSCTFENLTALTNLKKLTINVNDDKFNINKAHQVFFELTALQKLKIAWEAGIKRAPMPTGSEGEGADKKGSHDEAQKGTKDEKTSELLKLDLQRFPEKNLPEWVDPEKLTKLKHLCISGGILRNLDKTKGSKTWEVETLHLKFLTDVKTNWKELRTQFPNLNYLEKVKCPQITFCPCDANGVWMSKQP